MENFHDGLQDYAYTVILEELIRRRESQSGSLTTPEKEWLAEAKAALIVPQDLMKIMTEYSREPARLYAWRNRMGDLIDLIDLSGVPDVNPWGQNFGARGTRPQDNAA